MSQLSTPAPRRLKLKLRLPSFARLDVEQLRALCPDLLMDSEGWWEDTVDGWWLSASTQMAATAANTL